MKLIYPASVQLRHFYELNIHNVTQVTSYCWATAMPCRGFQSYWEKLIQQHFNSHRLIAKWADGSSISSGPTILNNRSFHISVLEHGLCVDLVHGFLMSHWVPIELNDRFSWDGAPPFGHMSCSYINPNSRWSVATSSNFTRFPTSIKYECGSLSVDESHIGHEHW